MVDKDFGNWIAGFVDGEGCFFMVPVARPGGYRPGFSLALRHDDEGILREIASALDVGSIHSYKGQSGHRVVRWHVQAQKDCQALVAFFSEFPLRAKKRTDFEIWAKAVEAAAALRAGRADNTETYAALSAYRDALRTNRKAGLENA